MLEKINLKNLTAFPQAEFRFAPGLNVFIGENGTGKTHILKAAYATIAAGAEGKGIHNGEAPMKIALQKRYAEKLSNVFRPDTLGKLVHRKRGRERCQIELFFSDPLLNCGFGFGASSSVSVQIEKLPGNWQKSFPVFLPARELLTIYPGFVSMYENRYLEFEETYYDTCLSLGEAALKGPREKKARSLLDTLEEAMGGKIELDGNGRFYLGIPGQKKMEIFLVAEGHRKLAMIARLVGTGALLDKGYLFWDEPEANLNPRLIKTAAQAVFHLCLNGIQVFMATHSLFLLREFEILSRREEFENVKTRYFALAMKETGVEVEQGDSADDLESLTLLEEALEQSDRYMDAGE